MAVDIDEAGRDSQTTSINEVFSAQFVLFQATYFDDRVTFHSHIGRKPKITGAIHNASIADDEIKLRLWCLSAGRKETQTDKRNSQTNPDHVKVLVVLGKDCCL